EPMAGNIPEIKRMAPYTSVSASPVLDQPPSVIASNENLAQIIRIHMASGRFISSMDKKRYFCVIGENVAKQIKRLRLLGTHIRIGEIVFTVVGIMDKWPENGFFSSNINDAIIVSLDVLDIVSPTTSITGIIMELDKEADIDVVKSKIQGFVRTN